MFQIFNNSKKMTMELLNVKFGKTYYHRERNKAVDLLSCDFGDGCSLLVEARDENGDVLSGEIFRCEAYSLEELTREQWAVLYPEESYDEAYIDTSEGTYQAKLERELARAKAQRDVMYGALKHLSDDLGSIIAMSVGVAGLHRDSGIITPWNELIAASRDAAEALVYAHEDESYWAAEELANAKRDSARLDWLLSATFVQLNALPDWDRETIDEAMKGANP